MAVTQLDVLKIAVGMFAGAPSAKITKMLTEWKGDARSLFATIGESVYTKQVSDYKGLDTKAAAALLVQNLGGDTLTAEVKGWATAYVEKALANNKGNIGLVAYDAVNFLATTEDANYAGVRKQLENRLEVAKAYVASTKGSEVSNFAILKNVTSNEVSRDKAIMDITGVDPSEVIIEGAIQLTNKADTPVLTTGNDVVQGLKSTLRSGDTIIDAQTSDNDLLKASITTDNDGAAPIIRRIETIDLDFKGVGASFNVKNVQDGTLKISSSNKANSFATINGLENFSTQNLTLDVAKSITDLTLSGASVGREGKVILNGQDIDITTSNIGELSLVSMNNASTAEISGVTKINTAGDNNLTLKGLTTLSAKDITNGLGEGRVLTIEAQASGGAANLSKAGAAVFKLNEAANHGAATDTLTLAKGATVHLEKDTALFNAAGTSGYTLATNGGSLNVVVNAATANQEVATSGVGTLNFTVDAAGKTLTGIKLKTTNGANDQIHVKAAKAVTIADINSASKTIGLTTDAETTITAMTGAATNTNTQLTVNAKTTITTLDMSAGTKAVQVKAYADFAATNFKGAAKSKWIFSGDKDITLGTGTFAAGNKATLDFSDAAGSVTITSLADASGGLEVKGGAGKLTIQTASASGDDITLGAGGGDITLGATASTVDGSAAQKAIVVVGGAGVDTIIGGAGNDTITGGANDVVTGGAGKDVFVVDGAMRINDFTAEDRLAILNESTNQFAANATVAAGGVVAGVTLGDAYAGKNRAELLQFGTEKTAFTLNGSTTGFIGSDFADNVSDTAATNGASIRLGKGNDMLDLGGSVAQTTKVLFEQNAADNGIDTLKKFNIDDSNNDKLVFSDFLGSDYKVSATDTAGDQNAVSGVKLFKANSTANVAIDGKVAVIEASSSVDYTKVGAENLTLQAFEKQTVSLGANQKAVVVLANGANASVFYVENDGNAAVNASEIKLVAVVEGTADISTMKVGDFMA